MMSVIIVGGLDRLERHYERVASKMGYKARIFDSFKPNLCNTLKNSQGVVMFTNLISHPAAKMVISTAKENRVPVVRSHKCGTSALEKCLFELKMNGRHSGCEGRCGGGCGDGCKGCRS